MTEFASALMAKRSSNVALSPGKCREKATIFRVIAVGLYPLLVLSLLRMSVILRIPRVATSRSNGRGDCRNELFVEYAKWILA